MIFATDEWFAIADNLLNPSPPTFDPNAYCEQGKVMDGWESRRRVSRGIVVTFLSFIPLQGFPGSAMHTMA